MGLSRTLFTHKLPQNRFRSMVQLVMGLMKRGLMVWFLFVMAICGFSKASVYKVGDSAGWTVIGNVDYNSWASSKTFQVGDTLVFEYDPRYHSVLQVSRLDFHSCDSTAPVTAYTTGNDSIVLRSPGHYYYVCGFVGHCLAGQKVDIRVPKARRAAAIPISSPIQAPRESLAPKASSVEPLAPSPSPSSGESVLFYNGLFSWSVGLLLIVSFQVFN